MIKSLSVLLAVVGCALVVVASDLNKLNDALNAGQDVSSIEESYVNYDLHQDLHYFRDDYVNEAFSRKKYVDTKVTMGGQARDMTGRQVLDAKYPFAVGQKSLGKIGVSTDRWDVKENKQQEYQYLALYHGYNSNFVVNKLRANLLRRLANALKDYLPVLDQANAMDLNQLHNTASENVVDIVRQTMKDTDGEIREQMLASDDSAATATVVIVASNYYIVANVGNNHAIAYNSMNEIVSLTPIPVGQRNEDMKSNLFGARKSRPVPCEPSVKIYPRTFPDEDGDEAKVHYILLESPIVSELVGDEEASKIVLSEIVQHRESLEHEQKMFEDSMNRLLQTASDRVSAVSRALFPEFFQKSDYAAILVSLDRDYKNIH